MRDKEYDEMQKFADDVLKLSESKKAPAKAKKTKGQIFLKDGRIYLGYKSGERYTRMDGAEILANSVKRFYPFNNH